MHFVQKIGWLLVTLLPASALGQSIMVHAGGNVSQPRTSHLVGDVGPYPGYQWGYTWVADTLARRADLLPYIRIEIMQRGYSQRIETASYQARFSSLTAGGGLLYHPHPFVALGLGIDVGLLFQAKIKSPGQPNKTGVLSTYRSVTLDGRFIVMLNRGKTIQPYVSVLHALRASLEYPRVDPVGNFHGTLHDLWPRTVQVGVHVLLYQ